MKLSCSVSVENRLLPTLAVKGNKKHVKSTLAFCKNPKSKDFCILLFSSNNKTGTKYDLKCITRVLSRFINEGKATIQFETPPHNLFIQADSILLKTFLHVLRRAVENKLTDKDLLATSMSVTATPIKHPPKKIIIQRRSEYPPKGFPKTVEVLHINHIKRCSLDRGILQLTKLRLLDVSHNCIEYLPTEISNLPCLNELNVAYNELGKGSIKQWEWLGAKFSKTLKLLDLSNNNLTFLPDQIVKLHSLISLHIDFNLLKTLPSGIGSLRHLRLLTASNNLISVLPGSARRWRLQNLDLSHNSFDRNQQINPAAIFPKPLPVCSLKEYSARRVLYLQLPYSSETLPRTVISYLEDGKYCVCGNACFNMYIRQAHMLLLTTVAQTFSVSSNGLIYVPIDCYFCSLKCFGSAHYNRLRQPII